MIKKKNLFFIILFLNLIIFNLTHAKINIILTIDDEIITNYDVKKESIYLKILNPQLEKLDNNQVLELAKQSLIKEIIKKKEISKFINLNENDEISDEYLRKIFLKLGYEDEDQFKNELRKNNTYTFDEIKFKGKIEIYWNELIYSKYIDQININKEKLLKKIDGKSINKRELLLSEIVFKKKTGESLEDLINKIVISINEIGFNNTANIYSISESSKFGGKIGWIQEETLSKGIYEKINKLKVNEISDVIKINNNFIILKIENIKFTKNNIDKDKELKKLIVLETNKKLENYSKIYFNRIMTNFVINEK